MSGNERKYCFRVLKYFQIFLNIFIYFIFDIILCVLVEFH